MNLTLNKIRTKSVLALLFMIAAVSIRAAAQTRDIIGNVSDAVSGEPLIGATIMAVGSRQGAVTDTEGNFTLSLSKDIKTVTVSYVGYISKTLPVIGNMRIKLQPDNKMLSDIVVIGYGTVRKSDLTGSVSTIKSENFNKGAISSPEQLINGKVAGLQIMSNSGSATAGSTIRVRGGASLNASNDPLIVLDGLPLEQGGISGNTGNFLSLINPADIESMTVLKDASSTAIYGSRASNGVIIITTKKARDGRISINFNTTNTLQTRTKLVDMLDRNQFVELINREGTAAQQALLGTASTDWNDEVYRTAFGTDNNLSISGKLSKGLPFRGSVGYLYHSGLGR